MNPCLWGYYGDSQKPSTCSAPVVTKYQKRISGPLLDRIDIYIEVPRVDYEKLSGDGMGETSESIRARVQAARDVQLQRFSKNGSARVYRCILKLARTIADLTGCEDIQSTHLAEACQHRPKLMMG